MFDFFFLNWDFILYASGKLDQYYTVFYIHFYEIVIHLGAQSKIFPSHSLLLPLKALSYISAFNSLIISKYILVADLVSGL